MLSAKIADSKAQALVHLGELSSARQALKGAAVAPGSQETLSTLSDPCKRPPLLQDPLPGMRTDSGRISVPPKEEQRQSIRHDNGAPPPTLGESSISSLMCEKLSQANVQLWLKQFELGA